MRQFIITDIHGCVKTFKALLNLISFSREDKLYLLGDYIDRGPDSKGVIDHIWNLENEGHMIYCLRGNHEQLFLYEWSTVEELSGINEAPGYPETLASFGTTRIEAIPEKYINWMKSLKFVMEVDNYILVHAGLSFQTSSPLEDNENLIWIRNWYNQINKDWLGNRVVVHGHTPRKQLLIKNSIHKLDEIPAINIDNGCCFKNPGFGHLCALELGTNKLTFQTNIDS